tara:strand:+ start:110 stop:769 length:660 start_codon:yes stop_codon:yes gene_type:complete
MANFNDRTINSFKAKLAGGGARPNLFEVALNFPDALPSFTETGASGKTNTTEESRFMVKAAELPASNIGDIPVNFRGRILHVAGDRTFDPWTVTIINNTDWSLRRTFEDWSNAINDRTWDSGVTDPVSYHSDALVYQLQRSNKAGIQKNTGTSEIPVVAAYKFFGIWPSQVSSIALDYGSTDTVEEFQVTFQVEYWAPDYALSTAQGGGKFTTAGQPSG